MTPKMTGDELRALRESRQLGQQEFATWLNEKLSRRYDRTRISRWENDAERIPQLVAALLRSPARTAPATAGDAVVVAFVNQKGGVAKTTSAVNTAYLLARAGCRVALVDCDAQGSATIYLGIQPHAREIEGKTLSHILTRDLPTEDALLPVLDELFDLIPSSISLAEAEAILATDPLSGFVLQGKLEEIAGRYDVILLDCPPNLGFIAVSALASADAVVIPSQTEMLSVMGISSLLKTLERVRRRSRKRCSVLGILPTLFNVRRTIDQDMLRRLEEFCQSSGLRLFPPVRDSSDYGKSVVSARPTLDISPNAPGADSYADIRDAIIGLITRTQETSHGA